MPVKLRERTKKGKKVFQVVGPTGSVEGEHSSRKKAVAQVQAINLSELRRKGRKSLPPAPKKKRKKRTRKR